MSDYRNPNFDPNDPRSEARFDPDLRTANAAWGWIAAAVFLVVVLAVAFGMGHKGQLGTNTASNDTTPTAATRMAPPPSGPAATNPATPMAPTPNTPAQKNSQ